MRQHKVVFSRAAEHDLEEIADYIAQGNPHKASETVLRIVTKTEQLATFPERHPLKEDLPAGHRFLIVGNYIVVYRIDADYVYAVRVVEGSRDIKRLLSSGDATPS